MSEANGQEQSQEQEVDLNEVNSNLQAQLNKIIQEKASLEKQNGDFFNELKGLKSKVNEFQSVAQNEEEKQLLLKGEAGYSQLLDKKMKQLTSGFDETISNISKEKDEYAQKVAKLENQIRSNDFRTKFSSILPQTDLNKSAYNDLTDLAMRSSEVIDGKIVFKDENGIPKTRNSQGKEYTELDFINEQRAQRSYMFSVQQGTDHKSGRNASGAHEMTDAQISAVFASNDEKAKKDLKDLVLAGKVVII